MSKTLIIAEKPSVAADLAKALGKAPGMKAFHKEKDHFENDNYLISSAVGHLVEIAMPMKGGKKIGWGIKQLPILPEEFELKPIESSQDRFKALKTLMKRKDVGSLINACDAGREGELIFRYIVEALGVDKPVQRLWMQSMTQGAILDAFRKLRGDSEMRPLADAAKCRSESDWLVGINATRAFTAYQSRHGGFRLTPAGRVQTPTLSILAKREREISGFVARDYFEVHALFGVKAGDYEGRWLDEDFVKDPSDEHKRPERIWDRAKAEAIVAAAIGKQGSVEQTVKPVRQAPPTLLDLTTLQREASNRFGFSARRTLQIAQALYEKYKLLTYPRTDSRYLPDDYVPTIREVLGEFSRAGDALAPGLATFARQALNEYGVKPSKRIFDSTKVSDHFAIVPTGLIPPRGLPEPEQKIFDLVSRRLVAVFFPAAEFEETTRITRVEAAAFRSYGKVLIHPGWQAVYGKKGAEEQASSSESGEEPAGLLVAVSEGERAQTRDAKVEDCVTKPPARFNEATLLRTMETAGKLVEDEDLAEAMSERGLGTPATRAAIIEGLISDGYIEREGRELLVTSKGLDLIDMIRRFGIEVLTSPELTGQWEYRLRQIEQRKLSRESFMGDIRAFAREVVQKVSERIDDGGTDGTDEQPELALTCGVCGEKGFRQTEDFVACGNAKCKVRVFRNIGGRRMSDAEISQLVTTRFVGPFDDFVGRTGKGFKAALEINDKGKMGFVFEKSEPPEVLGELCPCPVCAKKKRKSPICITEQNYICSEALRDSKACNGKLPRTLCSKSLGEDAARAFFTEGRTPLIEGPISKRGKPFKAVLICKAGDKRLLNWEFPPREKAARPAAKARRPKGKFGKAKNSAQE